MAAPHCSSVQELSAHLDGELSPPARVALEAHLASCPACAARLAELRAVGQALRRRFEAQAEATDFSGFAAGVLARLQPHRPSLPERLSVGFSEWRAHRPSVMWGGFGLVAAALVALLALPSLQLGVEAETPHPSLQAVSTDESSHVAPVVLKTEGGDAIIWLVDHPDRPSLSLGADASVPDVAPPPAPRPKGGEL
ncbi:MAG: anti-sigma factor family protein [Myxococcaceae bacterium]